MTLNQPFYLQAPTAAVPTRDDGFCKDDMPERPERPPQQHSNVEVIPNRQWLASAKLWNENERDQDLENELYNGFNVTAGINFAAYKEINVVCRGADIPPPVDSFKAMGLHPTLLQNVTLMKYKEPTVGYSCAQTGSGKTAAYVLPIADRLLKKGKSFFKQETDKAGSPIALILSPTRELACQIFDDWRKMVYQTWIRPCVIYGGVDMSLLKDNVQRGCDILVATPGRLMDMVSKKIITLSKVKFLVIDE
ncbi:ATP-dependent RNA helicase ddx3x, partial [Irineochytrium annulatum]